MVLNMIIDEKGKLFGKVSVIDIAIVCVILAVIAGLCVRYGNKITGAVESEKNFRYVMKVEKIRDCSVAALEKKGALTDKKSEKNMGEVVDVVSEPATVESTTADGVVTYASYPERRTCYVTIDAHGKESDENYILEDATELSVGRTVDLYTKYIKTSGTIVSVEVLD